MDNDDFVLDKMKELGVPLTRKNYLDFAYFGTPPAILGPEEEAMLPEQFRFKKGTEDDNQEPQA